WLTPPPANAGPSVNDGALLDLPLKLIAPLFMASQRKDQPAQTPAPKTAAESLTTNPPPFVAELPQAPDAPGAIPMIPMSAALRDLAPPPPKAQPPKAPPLPAPPAPPAQEQPKPFTFKRPETPAAPALPPQKPAAPPPPPVRPPAEPFTFTRRDQTVAPIPPVPPPAAPAAPPKLPTEPLAEPFSFTRRNQPPIAPPAVPSVPVTPPAEPPAETFTFNRANSPATDTPATVPPEPKVEESLEPFSFKRPEEPAPVAAAPAPTPVEPAPAPVPVAPVSKPVLPVFDGPTLSVPLMELAETWPDPARDVIRKSGLSGAKVEVPLELIGNALKQGKAAFPWKHICSWTKPASPELAGALEENTVVELPLRVIAPLFLTHQKFPKASKTVSIDDEIPDLFSNASTSPAPAPVAPAARPAPAAPDKPDTNYYTWDEEKETDEGEEPEEEKVTFKTGPSPGTSFLNRYATPNEIVSKAAAIEGVDGVLIALPDGLLVASKIPSSMNGDILAAFLPQIYGRLSQSTRELRMGELNNLSFTVGNIPWKIFRVGAIYFAAFGLAGQPLPGAQLAGIAAELDRKPSNKV
ncbi:MAG TPA: roadblock/LC7 domain-containing protein, partial [Verrucomicrobiae bacterium]|nr:roadblock/LC7 domain-containing protein [Verrucomicrobiae bacterium]